MSPIEKKISAIINELPLTRNRAIIRFRFGLNRRAPQTLEEIGGAYNITRERVRQIENDSLEWLRKTKNFREFLWIFNKLNKFFSDCGEVVLEERLINFLMPNHGLNRAGVLFLLEMGEPYISRPANALFRCHWASRSEALSRADKTINHFIKLLQKNKSPIPRLELIARAPEGVSEKAVISYLEITKLIGRNPLDEFGLSDWAEIRPRGVKDKAYIILKKQGRPLHFREITELINKMNFSDGRQAREQTVHNELIKDPRFKWVDRGVYAISSG